MWTISKNKDWSHLRELNWVADMEGVQQSPIYHAEGDVAIHTRMVLEELCNLNGYKDLNEQAQEILWAAALLHDVEKRSTTIIDEFGNISSPGHAKKGAQTARQILYREIVTPFAIREEIFGLVRHHGLPLWIYEKQDPIKSLLKASIEVNTEWVYILAKADVLGRICKDKDELLYKCEMFRELCIEQECWGKPKVFPSELGKFRYFRKEDQSPDFLPFEDTESEVILLSGLPGSGKDYYISQNYPGYKVISLDDLRRSGKIDRNDTKGNGRIIQAAGELAKDYLRNKITFIWNATNITAQMRELLINNFSVYNPTIKIVYIEVPYGTVLKQNKNRENQIPTKAIEHLVGKLEVPKSWEAHTVEYVIR